MITYVSKILGRSEDIQDLKLLLEYERLAFNAASVEQFVEKKKSIVILHSKFYKAFRAKFPYITSNVVIRAEHECLAMYRSASKQKHNVKKPIEKKRLSMRLDSHLYASLDKDKIKITTAKGRKWFNFKCYDKLKYFLDRYKPSDPLIFERSGDLYIAFSFENKIESVAQKLALGIDLGIRVSVATSDGKLIIDKKYNKEKRKLRFLKRSLKSKRTKSAKKHLRKIGHKEHNKSKNQTHLIANKILNTIADTIVLENLKGIKAKKHKFQNKNQISQVPLFELQRILTYKAENTGKSVVLVSPAYTSQTDCISGLREGERRGRRFYAKNGLVYDADINAARNIAARAKLPYLQGNLLAGQAIVTSPNACKSASLNGCVL